MICFFMYQTSRCQTFGWFVHPLNQNIHLLNFEHKLLLSTSLKRLEQSSDCFLSITPQKKFQIKNSFKFMLTLNNVLHLVVSSRSLQPLRKNNLQLIYTSFIMDSSKVQVLRRKSRKNILWLIGSCEQLLMKYNVRHEDIV